MPRPVGAGLTATDPAMEQSGCRSGLPKALPAVAGHAVNRDEVA